jgi:hypothetical protein
MGVKDELRNINGGMVRSLNVNNRDEAVHRFLIWAEFSAAIFAILATAP